MKVIYPILPAKQSFRPPYSRPVLAGHPPAMDEGVEMEDKKVDLTFGGDSSPPELTVAEKENEAIM